MATPHQRKRKGLYRGYSSYEFQDTKSFKLRDIELVKSDILNHIFTKKGERVMMPTFGTLVPELVFEPLTTELMDTVAEEIVRVINFDPRVELIDIQVTPDYDVGSLTVAAQTLYVEIGAIDTIELNITFES